MVFFYPLFSRHTKNISILCGSGLRKFRLCFSSATLFYMTGEQLISLNLKNYLSMKKLYGKDNPEVVKLYGKLKDMIIVEIYFMQDLRMTLDVEEMSGFVLFINDDLDSIISSYRSNRGRFFPYLKESLENLAMAYLKRKNKALTMYISYTEFYTDYPVNVAENNPEEMYFLKESSREERKNKALMFNALRYMCSRVKSRRKKLFTFFCTIISFLSRDVIDRFCESINCDREQTLIIAQHLSRIQEKENNNRYSKSYLSKMVDFHWAKILEYEGHAKIALYPEIYRKKADLNRKRLKESLRSFFNAKMNTSYAAVASILNLDPGTVASHVMYAKQILERVISDAKVIEETKHPRFKDNKLTRFEPFRVFGIGMGNRC